MGIRCLKSFLYNSLRITKLCRWHYSRRLNSMSAKEHLRRHDSCCLVYNDKQYWPEQDRILDTRRSVHNPFTNQSHYIISDAIPRRSSRFFPKEDWNLEMLLDVEVKKAESWKIQLTWWKPAQLLKETCKAKHTLGC